jgi:hypothetical protein
MNRWVGSSLKAVVVALSCAGLVSGAGKPGSGEGPAPLTVPKPVSCGPNDRPENALQGQVSAAERATPGGFKGFNCNLTLVGQAKGDGANWQTTQFRQGAKRLCGYHGTASEARSLPGRTNFGVRALDLSDPSNPRITAYLNTPSMHDPWESLKVNEARQVLGADNGQNGGGGPEVDIYDISQDCRDPQLIVSAPVGTGADGGMVAPIIGHEGSWAPDGLTYYGGDLRNRQYYAVDTSDLTKPKLITRWIPGIANVHGMSISDDGNRGYMVSLGSAVIADLTDPTKTGTNGLLIYDTSEIQARKPNPQVPLVGKVLFKDGSTAQHTIAVRIKGKPYIVFVDEGGSGGRNLAGWTAACAAGYPPFGVARLIDISDETNPKIVSRLLLETNDHNKCAQVLPDLAGLTGITSDSQYCSVDNRHNATTLACGYFNSGIRVFDIRDPLRPKEIAYYNPPGTLTASPGSNHVNRVGGWVPGGPDWCSAQVHLDARNGLLWSTCQDNGVVVLKFREGVWPFPGSSTPDGMQN